MNIHLVAAVALNGVIGDSKTNNMPWPRLPSDMKSFKELTTDKTIVMGRKTFESFGGKPLPNRRNVVITSDPNFMWRNKVITYPSVSAAMAKEKQDLYAIGGQRVYAEAITLLPRKFFITIVYTKPDGDVMFPSDGYSFISRFYMSPDFNLYHRIKESGVIEENGTKFQINQFERS